MGGALNTLLTYGVYWLLLQVLSYQSAYLIAYLLGIAFAYVFNAARVFKVQLSWRGLLMYPLVYLAQYLLGALLLSLIVERFGLSAAIAPLIITIGLLPVTYLMSKFVLQRSVLSPPRACTVPPSFPPA